MKNLIDARIQAYAETHSSPEPALLRRLRKETFRSTEQPEMLSGHLQGLFLKMLVQMVKARRILEIGTFTGYSTLSMAAGLPAGGRIITCDQDAKVTAFARRYWAQSKDGKKIRLVLGPARETLAKIKGLFDLIFIDADKKNYGYYWHACVPKLRRGGVIAVDNVLWSGRVLKPQNAVDRAIAKLNGMILNDQRFECVMLPFRDGLTLARKK